MKNTHTPAAMRKVGITALINYSIGAIIILVYGFLVSRSLWNGLPSWQLDVFNQPIEASLELLTLNDSELLRFILLCCLIFFLAAWWMFDSKIAIIRLRYFRGVWYGFGVVCVIYVLTFYNLHIDSFSDEIRNPLLGALYINIPVFIALFHFGNTPKILDEILNALCVYWIVWFLVVQLFFTQPFFWELIGIFLVPLFILYFKNIVMVTKEYVKETPLYRQIFILARRGESARFGGFYQYFTKDLGCWFSRNKERIWWTNKSTIFYGSTIPMDDIQVGRKIGTATEGHHITIAGPRAGKSTDVIYTNILNYAGGIIGLDPKGEITQVVWKRRSKERPFHVLDPFNVVVGKEGSGVTLKNSHWNPLEEIDINSSEAREQIQNLAEACIHMDKNETGNSAHFRENAQLVLRGYIAYVLSDPFLEGHERHLGTVFNFIKYGSADSSQYSPQAIDDFLKLKLTTNHAANGAAIEAANMLTSVADRERGGILSTVARGIDWINSTPIKSIICHQSDFKLSDAKTEEASIFLILPEEHLRKFSRLTASFFTMAINKCSNHITPQPKSSKRRVLMLFEEFSKLGYFAPVAHKLTIAAGSYMKFWFILQNLGQLTSEYKNLADFVGSSDLQAFGVDGKDAETLKFISESLGKYTETKDKENTYPLMTESEVAEFLDPTTKNQIIIPREGKPLKLKRISFWKLFNSSQYGKNTY